MGNCFQQFLQSVQYDITLRNNKGLLAPDGSRFSLEGMTIGCKVINIYPEGLVEISFKSNSCGYDQNIRRCVKLLDIGGYSGYENDLWNLLKEPTITRLHISVDRGYYYIGRLIIIRDGIVLDASSLLPPLQCATPGGKNSSATSPLERDPILLPILPLMSDPEIITLIEEPEIILMDSGDNEYGEELSRSIGQIVIIEDQFKVKGL